MPLEADRRHLTAEEVIEAAELRRQRIKEAKVQGKSTRQIAAEEGVSQKTIALDLQKETSEVSFDAGDTGVSPASKEISEVEKRRERVRSAREEARPHWHRPRWPWGRSASG